LKKTQTRRNSPEQPSTSRDKFKKCKLGHVTTEYLFLMW